MLCLWLDIFQKIKALGYTGVSFYVDWALLEGDPGHFTAEGIFDLEPFFEAASEAGIYLLARPGPYINAEVSGGGFPGWLARNPAILRTNETLYEEATNLYVSEISAIIAEAQITNGGPVILLQPENEYTSGADWIKFPDYEYMSFVEEQYRSGGITVPLINNDASVKGLFAPGTPAAVDIYGHDSYPLSLDCARPYYWPSGALPTTWHTLHLKYSPSTPYSLVEFQGGSIDPWGGLGFAQCSERLNNEFERVFYKNDFSFGVTIFNIYMTYGGTNWGNLGHAAGYTSYDYGAVIKEDRTVTREKYSEAKLEANFLKASPAYLTANPGNSTNATYTSTTDISVTPLLGNKTNFYVVRQSNYASNDSVSYDITVPSSIGNVTIPQLGGSLSLHGRDSKIHVTNYDVGGIDLIYSTAEVFTWQKSGNKSVLLLYGGAGETHELALPSSLGKPTIEGSDVIISSNGSTLIANWQVEPTRRILHFGDSLDIYLLWRNEAYNYWVLELPAEAPISNFTSPSKSSVVVKAGYLLRTASISGTSLYLTGDLNSTTTLEVIAGARNVSSVYFNGEKLNITKSNSSTLTSTLQYSEPTLDLPDLTTLEWKYVDSLPETKPSYDDSLWTSADHTTTNNTVRNLTTPTSLYADDYGYHAGSLIYRGHFTSNGNESSFELSAQGGSAFGYTIWLNSTFIGSWTGYDAASTGNGTYTLPTLSAGKPYILTIVIDHMGLDENYTPGYDALKDPRGILDYILSSRSQSAITWKLTGNLGGEKYHDTARGPLNEGAMYAERQGYHLPNPPSANWSTSSPLTGIDSAGIGFYSTSFDLDIPAGYDVPLSFNFTNTTSSNTTDTNKAPAYRIQLYVNGYQFGKYVNNIGPQTSYPVPQGILNHNGKNYIALTLWALEDDGAKVEGLQLTKDLVVQSGFGNVTAAPQDGWSQREGAY
ncbi:putative beta-galactosidase e [Phaeomoniella chlamydospora]|uniref:Beta-galactosidase n=1 Tax=Phaeomoniella chlamydospora TaxID=158046 RepID=A0A0G2GW59_PHACM|nr:putative beta-galactosidase e [Phaeomoniella chlamydospora]